MVQGKRKEGLVAELIVRDHHFISGVSENLGGHDEGADPHELLESALAACTIITGQMYANRKGYKLDSIDVVIRILSEGHGETKFSREVTYHGDLTAEEKDRLTQIINRCPIHLLLESKVTIETIVK
jgi:putative redox protein